MDAEREAHIHLSEELESYLVFLLLRFHKNDDGLYEPVGLKYLMAHESGRANDNSLRDIGDSCLLLAGMFPEQAKRRRVSKRYFMRLGRSCYDSLSKNLKRSHGDLYRHLCYGFGTMLCILQTIHDFNPANQKLDPMAAYDLWLETGNMSALSALNTQPDMIPACNHQQNLI